MKIHSGWEAPAPNRTHLMVECISCGKESLQTPFIQHCDDCRSNTKHGKCYEMHYLTKRWIAKQELRT